MGKIKNLIGKKFHRLVVIKFIGLNKHNKALWLCKCDCGNTATVIGAELINGNTKSCGCYNREKILERTIKHNMTGTRIYHIWRGMKDRCNNTSSYNYKNYGARGIKILKEWSDDFRKFYEWAVANGYKDDLTIDRINTNGNYEPSNCRWITLQEQQWNKRNNLKIKIDGKVMTTKELSKIAGISKKLIRYRYEKGIRGKKLLDLPQENTINDDLFMGTKVRNLQTKIYKNSSTGIKGVSRYNGKYRATINICGKQKHLGYFNTIEDAAKARMEAENKYYKPIIEKYENKS